MHAHYYHHHVTVDVNLLQSCRILHYLATNMFKLYILLAYHCYMCVCKSKQASIEANLSSIYLYGFVFFFLFFSLIYNEQEMQCIKIASLAHQLQTYTHKINCQLSIDVILMSHKINLFIFLCRYCCCCNLQYCFFSEPPPPPPYRHWAGVCLIYNIIWWHEVDYYVHNNIEKHYYWKMQNCTKKIRRQTISIFDEITSIHRQWDTKANKSKYRRTFMVNQFVYWLALKDRNLGYNIILQTTKRDRLNETYTHTHTTKCESRMTF